LLCGLLRDADAGRLNRISLLDLNATCALRLGRSAFRYRRSLALEFTHEELAKPSIAAQVTRAGGHGEQFHVMIGDHLVEVTS